MEQESDTNNNGPMDKSVEEKTDHQNGETSQPPNLQPVAKEEEEKHPTHSFKWYQNGKMPTKLTCNKAGTVEDVLKRSTQFAALAGKKEGKELVVLLDGKAISSHFPCSLIKNGRVTIKYVKAVEKLKKSGSGSVRPRPRRRVQPSELVTFHVQAIGGKNVVRILKNPAVKSVSQEMTVYAYKGETVKQALRRDGRILSPVLKKNCVLSEKITEVYTEMSNLVDDLDGKAYQIILLDMSRPPDSQPGSLDDATMENNSQKSDPDENQAPTQQSTTTESVNDSPPRKKPKQGNDTARRIQLNEIPDSEMMKNDLSSLFKNSVKGKRSKVPKLSHVQNLLRVEYGKNDEACREVKTMKKLMDLSNSVCLVSINGRPNGSGFLLFGNFVLTNAHVVKGIQPTDRVTVRFSFESLDEIGEQVEVKEVAAGEYGPDPSRQMYDWALLRLRADQTLPQPLLSHFEFLPKSGGICIIGHPNYGVKKIDPCLIVGSDGHKAQWVTDRFFGNTSECGDYKKGVLAYKTCFYFGSSGSPVFDEWCRVVAVHSGGYWNKNRAGGRECFLDYGFPLSLIMEHILVQMVERKRFDVLTAYLSCSYAQHFNIMTNVKKLVESRNNTVFKDAVNSLEPIRDERLKKFCKFFSQKEEPVSMETNQV